MVRRRVGIKRKHMNIDSTLPNSDWNASRDSNSIQIRQPSTRLRNTTKLTIEWTLRKGYTEEIVHTR